MTDPKYAAFTALDPFFDIVQQGLTGLVDGDHYFDTIADDAEFAFRYHFPGWPQTPHSTELCGRPTGLRCGEQLPSRCSVSPSRLDALWPPDE